VELSGPKPVGTFFPASHLYEPLPPPFLTANQTPRESYGPLPVPTPQKLFLLHLPFLHLKKLNPRSRKVVDGFSNLQCSWGHSRAVWVARLWVRMP
jgi:hypothetical protein